MRSLGQNPTEAELQDMINEAKLGKRDLLDSQGPVILGSYLGLHIMALSDYDWGVFSKPVADNSRLFSINDGLLWRFGAFHFLGKLTFQATS